MPEPLFFIIKEMIKKKIIKSEDKIVDSLSSLSPIEYPCLISIYPLIMNFSNTQWIEDKIIQLIRCKKIDIHRVFPFIKKILLNKRSPIINIILLITDIIQNGTDFDKKLLSEIFHICLKYHAKNITELNAITNFFKIWIKLEIPSSHGHNAKQYEMKNIEMLLNIYKKTAPINENQAKILIELMMIKKTTLSSSQNIENMKNIIQNGFIDEYKKELLIKQVDEQLFALKNRLCRSPNNHKYSYSNL